MADITYLNKDKTAALGTAPRTWRDEDANEVKNIINNFRAHLVAGKVPQSELPDVAIKIGSASDFDGTGIADDYILYWDATAGKFRVKAGIDGGVADVELDSNQLGTFIFDSAAAGGTLTLLIGFSDQVPGSILAAPSAAAGTPIFRQIVAVLEALVGANQFNVDYTRGGSAFDLVNDFYQDGTILDKGLNIPLYRIDRNGIALAPETDNVVFTDIIGT